METIPLYLIAVLGSLIHIGSKFIDKLYLNDKDVKKSWKQFNVLFHIIVSSFTVITLWILIYIRHDIEAILPMTTVTVLFYSYGGDSVLKRALDNKFKQQ
jgi:hypothetical protein